MNVFEASSCIGMAFGVVVGPLVGWSVWGLPGCLVGLPAGVVLGWLFPPLAVFAGLLFVIVCREGRAAAWRLLRSGRNDQTRSSAGQR
jgi:hypothetical protein